LYATEGVQKDSIFLEKNHGWLTGAITTMLPPATKLQVVDVSKHEFRRNCPFPGIQSLSIFLRGEIMKGPLSSILLALLSFSLSAFAQASDSTIAKIKSTGTIVLGVREASPPFSTMASANDQAKGYSIDLCMKVVDALRKELKLKDLNAKQVVITPSTRIAKVVDGTVDLECGSTTRTREREQQVAFSYTTFVAGTRFLVKRASNIKSIDDLRGKVVVVTQGTSNEKLLTAQNTKQKLGIKFITAQEHQESFSQVQSEKAVAFALDDALLAGLIAKSNAPQDYEIVGKTLSIEPYALMFRKNDSEFEAIVNKTLLDIFYSGEVRNIYNHWFVTKDINFPMTAKTLEAFKTPNKYPSFP
jgi:glutamate/aspartate transport system substrate-binding protein